MEGQQSYEEILNSIQFDGFSNIKCGDMLHYPVLRDLKLANARDNRHWVTVVKYFLKCLKLFFTEYYSNSITKQGCRTLFLFSSAYGNRADLLSNFLSVTKLIDDKTVAYAHPNVALLPNRLDLLRKLLVWNKALKGHKELKPIKPFLMYDLLQVYSEYNELNKKIGLNGIQTLICFCDVHPVESMLTQTFNLLKKQTITLQHGVYSSIVNDWVFRGSRSRYMLGYGQFTIDEGKKVQTYNGKIIPVGSMSFIEKAEPVIPDKFSNKEIGLILDGEDGPGMHELNASFILFTIDYCKKRNKRLKIKFHPASDINQYANMITDPVVDTYYGKEMNLLEFIKHIDVAVVRNSTCIIETLHFWIPTLIFHEENQKVDVYGNVKGCKFSNGEELDYYLENINNPQIRNMLTQMRNYLCYEDNAKARFKNTIEMIQSNCL